MADQLHRRIRRVRRPHCGRGERRSRSGKQMAAGDGVRHDCLLPGSFASLRMERLETA
jgi:hypothetical protein